jgi:putative membrane protein
MLLAMGSTRLISLLIRWLMLSVAVWVAAELVGGIQLEGWESTLAVAAILGLLNLYVRPVLVLLSLPLTIITLGLFLVVINAILLGLTDLIANIFDSIHFNIDGVGSALLGALIISLVSVVLGWFINPDRIAGNFAGRRLY